MIEPNADAIERTEMNPTKTLLTREMRARTIRRSPDLAAQRCQPWSRQV